jgi:hypothetical protein
VPTHPVAGQVFFRNKPVAEAMVVFHPLSTNAAMPNKPIAYTDSAGNFVLTTMKTGDGAPAGEYAITIELREAVLQGEEKTRSGRSLLPERYRHPDKSGLRYRVTADKNEVPRIDLKN